MGVYQPGSDALAENGRTGLASRQDSLESLSTEVAYNAFGDAVASRDLAGSLSYKVVDRLGRVRHEIDALGYVTSHEYNVWGQESSLARHADALPAGMLAGASGSAFAVHGRQTAEHVAAVLDDAAALRGPARVLSSLYDQAGRLIQTMAPQAFVYDAGAAAGQQYFQAGQTTRYRYDVFGDLVRSEVLVNPVTDTWSVSSHWFNRRSEEVATVDALGYLTTRRFDAAGQLLEQVEHAQALQDLPGGGAGVPVAPLSTVDDRRTTFAYDSAGRRISQTRVGVEVSDDAGGGSARVDLTDSYGYDALGNLVRSTDAAGATTWSYYDALGRLSAVAGPTRGGSAAGGMLTPLSTYGRDAFGNALLRIDHALGAASADGAGFSTAPADAADRRTLSVYDSFGHLLRSTDASGADVYRSWNASGQLAKQWQMVSANDGAGSSLFQAWRYDRLGRQTEQLSASAQGVSVGTRTYNGYGELVSRGRDGGAQEYFDYDGAGHLWRSNGAPPGSADAGGAAGDGVDKVYLYDLAGNVSAQIRSGGSGRADIDLRAYASADQVAPLNDVQRTDTRRDALGRVLQQAGGERLESQGGVTVRPGYAHANILASSQAGLDESGGAHFFGANALVLTWASLSALGSGDVKVVLDYATQEAILRGGVDEAGNPVELRDESGHLVYASRSVRRTLTRIVTAEQGAAGLRLDWSDGGAAVGGIAAVSHLLVYKKDVAGNWQVVIDQSLLGYAGNSIEVARPADPATALALQLRPAGSSSDPEGGWQDAGLVVFADAARFDAGALADGSYEYRVLSLPPGAPARISASGNLTLAAQPLALIDTALSFNLPAPAMLSWHGPETGVEQVLRWRPTPGQGAWQNTPVQVTGMAGQLSVADLSALAPGAYELELLWRHAGEDRPFAHATGIMNFSAEVPAYQVAQVGVPPVEGLRIGQVMVGGTPAGFDESGAPIQVGGRPGAVIAWSPLNGAPAQFRYRPAGSDSWIPLPVQSTGAMSDESGGLFFPLDESGHASGSQYVIIAGLPAGVYEYTLEQRQAAGATPVHHALGRLTISAALAGHEETREVEVQETRLVTPDAPAAYITGWTGQGPSYGPPVVVGTDPLGQPVFGQGYGRDIIARDESGNALTYGPVKAIPYDVWHTETRTDSVPVTVLVSNDPVPLLDESGHPVTTPIYETRYGSHEEAYQVAVQGPAIVIGTDEAGKPVYALDESGAVLHEVRYETRYRTVQDSTQVLVGSTPVYATDESGNVLRKPVYEVRYQDRQVEVSVATRVTPADPAAYIISDHSGAPVYGPPVVLGLDESGAPIYGAGYAMVDGEVRAIPRQQTFTVTRQQQVWVEGVTPAPVLADTTPPYHPAYEVPRRPPVHAFVANTRAGSGSVSQPDGLLTQTRNIDGDSRWVRPVIDQSLDRWGNVVALSDARSASWVTRYRYNAGNQLVQEFAPDSVGNGSATPTSSIYYDRLGRQVAVRDANGNLNGSVWDQGGNLVRELHADGGVVSHRYNAFGERTGTIDAMGKLTSYNYDRLGRLVQVMHAAVEVYQVDGSNKLQFSGATALSETMGYDQAGRKLWSSNGNGETLRYSYDPAGNVSSVTSPLGQVSRSSFDARGNKIGEVDANGHGASWEYDYFGRLLSHVDLGGASVRYSYDHAGQLLRQTSSRGQDLSYAYDGAGQILRITDAALGKVSSYEYDLGGRHVREKTVQGGVVYQDNHLAYDALGRLRDVADGSVHILIDYDRAGNRQRIVSHVIDAADRSQDSTRYFAYDAMNRQTLVDGLDAAGAISAAQGNRLTYDKNGNRSSDTSWGNHVSARQVVDHYELREVRQQVGVDENNRPIFGLTESSVPIYRTEYVAAQGESTETYVYDALDRLASVTRNDVLVDVRHYDGASRVLSSGPQGGLPVAYVNALNGITSTGQTAAGNGSETRINRYDANGRLLHQRVLKSDNSAKFDIDYSSYDSAGNLLAYTLQNHDGEAYTNTYRYTSERFDAYREVRIDASSSRFEAGSTSESLDPNGYLSAITDATKASNNRRFVNDAGGHALYIEQAGRVLRQVVVNGEVLGSHGQAVDPSDPVGRDGDPNFIARADFNFGFRPVAGNYPEAAPGLHVVAAGDTLAGIARVEYGDSQLWYVIAEANGLRGDADLRVGQALSIPSRVTTVHNGSENFRPYDPSRTIGDTTPNMPVPAASGSSGGNCGGIGSILVAVVAVAVAAISGQWYLTSAVSAGTSATAATAAATTATVTASSAAAATAYSAGSLAVAGAFGGALGSIAGQLAGNLVGIQSGLDWKGVALGALGGGVGGAVSALDGLSGNAIGNAALRSAITSVVTQGVAVVTGLQSSFNWRSVAAAAAAGGIGEGVTGAQADSPFSAALASGFGAGPASLALRSLSAITAGLAGAAMRGGRIEVAQIATDAFGNALGESLAAENLAIGSSADADLIAAGGADNQPDESFIAQKAQAAIDASSLYAGGGEFVDAYRQLLRSEQIRSALADDALSTAQGPAQFRSLPTIEKGPTPVKVSVDSINQSLGDAKSAVQDRLDEIGAWGVKRNDFLGDVALHVGATLSVIDQLFQPANLVDVGLYAAGPAIGKALGAGVKILNKVPGLGADIGAYAGKMVSELGEQAAIRFEQMQGKLGLQPGITPVEKTFPSVEGQRLGPIGPSVLEAESTGVRNSGFIFRGDDRGPEVIFNEGFQPRGKNTSLYAYVVKNVPSIYVPATTSPNVARYFAEIQFGGFVYTMRRQPQGLDVNAILGKISPYPTEFEIAVPGGIHPTDIMGARAVTSNGIFTGRFIKNPKYNP